jgi:hypothetical protein
MSTRALVLSAAVAAAVYALSPMTVWFAVLIVPAVAWPVRGLDPIERRWVVGIVAVAIALRLLAVAGLFLTADHMRVPYAAFFGDEDYFIKRSLWLRNVSLGIAVHPFDLEYAFEPTGRSSFLYLLALLQWLVGPAPYGLHLLSILFYVAAALLLYRVARRGFGVVPAMFGLIALLFLPSLFAWSIGVLKESPFVLLTAISLALAMGLVRADRWARRIAATTGIVAAAAVLQTVRSDGGVFALAATALGLVAAFVITRPRLLLATVVVLPIATAAVLRVPEVQLRTYAALQRAARQHWGAVVVSPGFGYKLLDERFYANINTVSDMQRGDAARFVARGVAAYLTVPRPWDVQSRIAAAYVPEQIVWYVLIVLVAAGLPASFRRDPRLTSLLAAHAFLLAAAAALTDGNVGTLVRHRGLALQYLVWLAGVGACEVALAAHRRLSPPPVSMPFAAEMRLP